MNYQELQEEVKQLDGQPVYDVTKEELENDPHIARFNHDLPKSPYRLDNEGLMRQRRPDLIKAFEQVKKSGQKWHSFVREIFYSKDELDFLQNELLRLSEMRVKSHKTYYELNLSKGTVFLPDRISQISRFHVLFDKFVPIYRKVLRNIHFENPIQENYGKNINGKINWTKTIQLSKTKFPTDFLTETWQREFEHSGNILLVLCLRWQLDEANKILQITYNEKLEQIEIEYIVDIIKKIKKCLDTFPFPDVVNSANKYARLDKNSKTILKLKKDLQIELKQKIIRNPVYKTLLEWIDMFNTIDFSGIGKHSSNYRLDRILDIDLSYEAWIFESLYHHFNLKYTIKNSLINSKQGYFEFIYKERTIIVHHGKPLPQKDYGKVLRDEPDYTLFVDQESRNNLFCVLDAKNMNRLQREQKQIILEYTHPLQQDCNLGALISKAEEIKWAKDESGTVWNFCLRFNKESEENNKKTLELIHDEIIEEIDRFLDRKSSE